MLIEDLPTLNLPRFEAQLRRGSHSDEIYDPLRRRWLALTPEEWVRQHFTAMLIAAGYSPHLTANEVGIRLNGTLRRCDTVVYGRNMQPSMVCEYKAPRVAITQRVFDQVARYNLTLGARFLAVSNGLHTFCCRYTGNGYEFLPTLPAASDVHGR